MTTTTTLASDHQSRAHPQESAAESQGLRAAAAAGVAFVVLDVVVTFLPGAPPASNASASKIAAYFRDHPGAIKAQLLIGGLGIVGLLWWFGALWQMLSRAEGERPRLAIVAAVSLATGVVLAMISTAFTAAAAIRVDNVDTTHLLYSLSLVVVSAAGFGIAAFLVAACVVLYRSGAAPRWTSYLGFAAALAFLGSTLGIVSNSNVFNVLGIAAFLIWCVWTLAISGVMWRSASAPM
jgi:hypothetical protein